MKYSYKPEVLEIGTRQSLVLRLPDEIGLVETFLGSDIQSMEWGGAFFLDAIDKVLSGQEQMYSVGGNVIGLHIGTVMTQVVDTLAEEDEEDSCFIETEELKKLILVWLDELEKFNQDQKA